MGEPARLTVRRRRLGQELRQLRLGLGWTQHKVAHLVGRPPSAIAKIERAEQGLTPDELLDLLDAYRVTDPHQRAFLAALRRDANKKGWWNRYKGSLSPATMDLISLEADAKRIRIFQPLCLPGILQIEEYVRTMLAAGIPRPSPASEDEFVTVRLTRQQILAAPNPPHLAVIIGETTLRQLVGGHAVMAKQLLRLLEVADLPHMVLQVLPYTAGAVPGMEAAFTILDVGERGELTVARVEALNRAWYLEDRADLADYGLAFERLAEAALSPAASRALIGRVLSDL